MARRKSARKKAQPAAAVTFARKSGTPIGAIALTGLAARIHESPHRIKQLMDLLDLPKGTDAKVFAKASTVIVR